MAPVDIAELLKKLEKQGFSHAYIVGSTTITSFLNHKLIDEMTITRAPVLLAGIGLEDASRFLTTISGR